MKKIFLLLCMILLAHPVWADETVKIGFLGPTTGPFAGVGREAGQVLNLMTSDINGRGGLLGRKVEMVFASEGEDDRTAASAARQLVQQGVVAVIGPHTSDRTQAVQRIFRDAGILQISYGSTAVPLTEKGFPYFFRTCPRDDEQAKAFVRVLRKPNFKKVAVLHDQSLYGKSLAQAVAHQLHAWMISVVYSGSLTPDQSDATELLKKIQAAGPDMIFFAGYYPEAAGLLRAKRQLQWKVPLMGGDGVNHPQLAALAGKDAAEGFHFLSPPNPEHLETPQARAFLERFRKIHAGNPSSVYPLLAGNAFLAFTQSATQVKTTETKAVADYLHRRYFNKSGLTGEIFFNVWGDVVNDLYAVYFVDANGRFILKRQIRHGDFI